MNGLFAFFYVLILFEDCNFNAFISYQYLFGNSIGTALCSGSGGKTEIMGGGNVFYESAKVRNFLILLSGIHIWFKTFALWE